MKDMSYPLRAAGAAPAASSRHAVTLLFREKHAELVRLAVLYRRHLNVGTRYETTSGPDPLSLTRDSTGQHWIVMAGIIPAANGWLYQGRPIPLAYAGGGTSGPGTEAW